jgi:quinol monooxygenase YgiN
MRMISFSLRLVVPSTRRRELLESVEALLPAIRVQPDCITARLHIDAEDANVVTLVEQWNSRAALDRHLGSECSRVIVAAMELASEPPEVRFDSIRHIGGMEVFAAQVHTQHGEPQS